MDSSTCTWAGLLTGSVCGGSGGSGSIAAEGGAGTSTSTTTDMGGSVANQMGGAPPVLADSGLVADMTATKLGCR